MKKILFLLSMATPCVAHQIVMCPFTPQAYASMKQDDVVVIGTGQEVWVACTDGRFAPVMGTGQVIGTIQLSDGEGQTCSWDTLGRFGDGKQYDSNLYIRKR